MCTIFNIYLVVWPPYLCFRYSIRNTKPSGTLFNEAPIHRIRSSAILIFPTVGEERHYFLQLACSTPSLSQTTFCAHIGKLNIGLLVVLSSNQLVGINPRTKCSKISKLLEEIRGPSRIEN